MDDGLVGPARHQSAAVGSGEELEEQFVCPSTWRVGNHRASEGQMMRRRNDVGRKSTKPRARRGTAADRRGAPPAWRALRRVVGARLLANALSENIFTEKSDVYAYAIVIWEVLTRYHRAGLGYPRDHDDKFWSLAASTRAVRRQALLGN